MSSIKSFFSLAILLACGWLAISQQQPSKLTGPDGTPRNASDSILSNLTRMITAFSDDAAPRIASELRGRGLSIGDNPSSMSPTSLSAIAENATSAIRDARRQFTTKLGQNNDANLLSTLTNMSQLDERQIVSQLQSKVQRLIQQTGSPNPELRVSADSE